MRIAISRDTPDLPKVVTLETCEFPIIEGDVAGYKVLSLPQELRTHFTRGAHVIRVNSREVAKAIPDFGGKGSGENHSLLPHQDHLVPTGDKRQYLMLTKHTDTLRGASTIMWMPHIAETLIPLEEEWIQDKARRRVLANERRYDPRFKITERQYDRCFDTPHGYEQVIAEVAGRQPSKERMRAVRLGILGYLMRGPSADEVMAHILQTCQGMYYEETWEAGGVVIINNPTVFHGRRGANIPALQRNFCV